MGTLGSETALEELTSQVLGDLLKEGTVAKLPRKTITELEESLASSPQA